MEQSKPIAQQKMEQIKATLRSWPRRNFAVALLLLLIVALMSLLSQSAWALCALGMVAMATWAQRQQYWSADKSLYGLAFLLVLRVDGLAILAWLALVILSAGALIGVFKAGVTADTVSSPSEAPEAGESAAAEAAS